MHSSQLIASDAKGTIALINPLTSRPKWYIRQIRVTRHPRSIVSFGSSGHACHRPSDSGSAQKKDIKNSLPSRNAPPRRYLIFTEIRATSVKRLFGLQQDQAVM